MTHERKLGGTWLVSASWRWAGTVPPWSHCPRVLVRNSAKDITFVLPLPCSQSTPSTARVSVSDLRMPLMWRDTDHFKNKGDHRRFAVFVLTRIGTQILDSTLLCPVDRSLTDITYPDVHVL